MQQLKVILSGGGTGGHIFPAIAIANELKKMVPQAEILFVGALGRMEMEKVPAAGYTIVGLPIAGIQRRLTLQNLKFPFLLLRSMLKAKSILKEFQPQVVVGTGGYASGPMLREAASKGIPTLIQEQNSYAGITNKLLSAKVNRVCVAYEGMEKFFPKEKILLTGNPVRQDIREIDSKREEALAYFKLDPSRPVLLVIGGSLGARTINDAIGAGLGQLADQNVQLIWQTGKSYIEKVKPQIAAYETNGLQASDFIQRMDLAYAAADVVVSRAGASSVSELCNTAKPCILVPSPNVAEDHQTKNAMALVNKQAAVLVKDADAAGSLVSQALQLIADKEKQATLSVNIRRLAFYESATVIAKEVLKLAKYPIA